MKILAMLVFVTSACTTMPQIADDIEKIADNDAITIKCDRDAFQKETNVHINVDVINTPESK